MVRRTDKLRFGVIGTGEFSQSCHVPGLQSHPRAEVAALCGSDPAHVRAVADRLGVPEIHTDYEELCSREDLDGITIASPNVFHARQAVAALRHGKHVFCEKPLGISVEEVRDMIPAAEAAGTVHQVAFTFRYNYGVQELRRRIKAGDIGQPYYLRVQYDSWKGLAPNWQGGWREAQDIAGGGILFDLGSHLFDIACFVLGPLEAVTGFVHHLPRKCMSSRTGAEMNVETDDIAAAWFRHRAGARGQFFISRATPFYTENGWLEVVGPEGSLKASLSRGKVDRLKISRPALPDWQELRLPEEARDGKPHSLGIMMRSYVDACLRGKLNGDVDASFHDGMAAQSAIESVLEANDMLRWVSLDPVAKTAPHEPLTATKVERAAH